MSSTLSDITIVLTVFREKSDENTFKRVMHLITSFPNEVFLFLLEKKMKYFSKLLFCHVLSIWKT